MSKQKPDRTTRDAIFEQLARVGHAVSHPTRLKLLGLLMQGEKPVELLGERCEQTVVNVSAHLKVLREAHLVKATRSGRQVLYRVESRAVEQLFLALRTVAEGQLPEMRELVEVYQHDRDTLTCHRGKELLALVRAGTVLLVDMRPSDEFEHEHLPGASSIPFDELSRRMSELPDDREIVAYCRGPYCLMGVEGVRLMRRRGKRASRLSDGLLEWRAQGMLTSLHPPLRGNS